MKNLLLFSTLLLSSSFVFAQLTVKPTSAGTDSYVYVKDQVVFVTKEVNLTRNGITNDQEASIYLRNNGQLIQGETSTSTNSGSGQLSVQQNTPETNAWSYYYWCSPITHTAIAAGNRSFGVQHLYESNPGLSATSASQVSTTPNREGTTGPMTISTRWLYTHMTPGTEAAGNYTRMNGNNAAPAGFGFTMKGVGLEVPGNDQTYEFRGRPNNGEFTIPVDTGLMTLSGNPYPSALDLNKLFYETGNEALGTFWYYDEDRTVNSHNYSDKPYGYGTYVVGTRDNDSNPTNGPIGNEGFYTAATFYIWNAGGTHGGNGSQSTNSDKNKRFAPIGQGIMFVGDDKGNVTIKNSHRVFFKEDTVGSVFQRPTGDNNNYNVNSLVGISVNEENPTASEDVPVSIPDYRISQMRLWTVFDEAVTRDMLVIFYDQATDGYDRGLDGLSPMGMHTDAYFPIGDDNDRKPYVINGIKYDYNKQIPIAFKLKNQTKFEIKAVEEVKKPYENAYLFDSEQNTYQQITNGQGATFNLPAGKYDNRFFIVFRNPNLKRDAPLAELEERNTVMEKVSFFQNNPLGQLEVENPDGYTLKSAAVYDMNGKLVINEKNLGDNNRYSFYTGNLSDGVYLVKLTTSNDIIIDYKAIVHNR